MKAVVSIHDVTPYFEKELLVIRNRLDFIKKSWLVTPFWAGKHPIHQTFADILPPEEKVLHGLTHQGKADLFSQVLFKSKSLSREFRNLSLAETADRIEKGKQLFEDVFHEQPKGFIPPNWYHNRHTHLLLREKGFQFTENWTSWEDLTSGKRLTGLPHSFDYGQNMALSRMCLWHSRMMISHRRPSFIRFAIHPQDVQHGFIDSICERIDMLVSQDYQFCDYSDLMS